MRKLVSEIALVHQEGIMKACWGVLPIRMTLWHRLTEHPSPKGGLWEFTQAPCYSLLSRHYMPKRLWQLKANLLSQIKNTRALHREQYGKAKNVPQDYGTHTKNPSSVIFHFKYFKYPKAIIGFSPPCSAITLLHTQMYYDLRLDNTWFKKLTAMCSTCQTID